MYSESQRSATILLEDGLWVRSDPECSFDRGKPKNEWPNCADWIVVSGHFAVGGSNKKAGETPDDIFIAEGDPAILQAKLRINNEATETYLFAVINPVARADSGLVTSVDAWAVACGTETAGSGSSPNIEPYPGFDKDCHPESVEALRKAALKSPTAETLRWEWVRPEQP